MSLSERLRGAAIQRALRSGHVVDSCVLGPDGVIDLRVVDDPEVVAPSTRATGVLDQTLGGFRAEMEIDSLYDDNGRRSGWQRLRRDQ